jgi:UDP-N-acetylglucosamine 2-epimerase (non-hydrolysing)
MAMKIALVFGARPNFMKIAPIYRAMDRESQFDPVLIHTGQHFDADMSQTIMDAVQLPEPCVHLEVGPGSQAWQLGEIVKRLEPVLAEIVPTLTIVVGDVTSTLAAALASSTLAIPIAHIEAGLRSNDWAMPEERNRVLTDRLSRYLFTHSPEAEENLVNEGVDRSRIHYVGNVMIDSLDWALPRLSTQSLRARFGVATGRYGIITIHRPETVDNPSRFRQIAGGLTQVAAELPLLFPMHPRTRARATEFDVPLAGSGLTLLPPLGYLEFIALLSEASIVLTDSGGIQEEATVLGVPCLTLRDTTERPITIAIGSNEVVGTDPDRIVRAASRQLQLAGRDSRRPPLWDGHAAERIVEVLARELSNDE